jgi:glycerol-3-phosphate dehydrogenase
MKTAFDLLVIGGGVNGAGIARDAQGRGLSTCLVERGDLAGATSSSSSKLIHGGLRYLEQYEFRLVREALAEREVLLRIAPHIVWPMRFVLPHRPDMKQGESRRFAVVRPDGQNRINHPDGRFTGDGPQQGDAWVYRAGKKAAGRLLDGRAHDEFPEAAP